MHRLRRKHPLAFALYLNAALVVALITVLLSRDGRPILVPAAYGQNQPAFAGGAGLFIVPGQLSERGWGCYLMDVDAQTLCAYQYFPGERQLRLVAARNFRYDRQLGNYNTEPAPSEIKDLVEKERAGIRGKDGG